MISSFYISYTTILQIAILFLILNLIFLFLKYKYKDKVNYNVIYGMLRTEKYINIMERLSKTYYSKFLSISSLILSPILIGIAIYFLVYGIIKKTPSFAPLIPGASIGPVTIPILESIIAIFIAALIHEMAHGVLVYKNGLSLKSWGFFYIGPLLGAFVEPKEEEIIKLNKKNQIEIFGAGSSINFIVGLIFFGLLFFYNSLLSILNLEPKTYVKIVETINGTYAHNVVPVNVILYSIENYPVESINDIPKILSNFKPGDNITLYTSQGNYTITLSENNGKPFMGIKLKQEYEYKNDIIPFIQSLLVWLFIINIGLGIGNMLPIYPLDGGRTIKAIVEMFIRDDKKIKQYVTIISIITLILLLANLSFNFI